MEKQKTQIFKSWTEFYNRENKELNGVSEEFAKENQNYETDNEDNNGCWNCSDCSGLTDNKPTAFKMPETPIIENQYITQGVL